MKTKLPVIKDKFDTQNAQKLVKLGYPKNKKALVDLICWSCFPNDPVCHVTYPFIEKLSNAGLARGFIDFVKFSITSKQEWLIKEAFSIFIKPRGETFFYFILSKTNSKDVKKTINEYCT